VSQQWTDLQRYVIEEHFEEYAEGRISRRELLRRVTYITGGVAASLAALSALGCNVDRPAAQARVRRSASNPAWMLRGADPPLYRPPILSQSGRVVDRSRGEAVLRAQSFPREFTSKTILRARIVFNQAHRNRPYAIPSKFRTIRVGAVATAP